MNIKGCLICDWGYIWDFYAILVAKNKKKLIRYDVVNECAGVIIAQIGTEKFNEILNSPEFAKSLEVNLKTFDLVEEARKDDNGLAHLVDSANMERYFAKNDIQKKFFGSENSEKKS